MVEYFQKKKTPEGLYKFLSGGFLLFILFNLADHGVKSIVKGFFK